MFGNRKKLNFFQIKHPLYFIILAVILTSTAFLLFLESFKTYQAEIKIIFIPKNEIMALQADKIAENLAIISGNLSFYEKMLRDNPAIPDQYLGLNKDERKKKWNQAIKVKYDNKGTIIIIASNNKNKNFSSIISKQIALTLFDTAAYYYDIKKDLDFKIIDGPIISKQISDWETFLLISLTSGILMATIIYILFINLPDYFLKYRPKNTSSNFFIPSDSSLLKKKIIIPKKDEGILRKETFTKTAQAPENLPVSFVNKEKEVEKKSTQFSSKVSEISEKAIKTQEPTEDEYKKRLNQLLRGEF